MNTQPAARGNGTSPAVAAARPSLAPQHSGTARQHKVTRALRRWAFVALAACWLPALAATVVIDVRTPAEYAAGHIDGAINIEYQLIGQQIAAAGVAKDDQVILYCRSGRRSGIALETLRSLGFRSVVDYGTIDDARQKLANRQR